MDLQEAVHLCEPDPAWPAIFADERNRVAVALRLDHARVEHIGSTAVPGLIAKPIVDVQIGLAQYPPSAEVCRVLEHLGYTDHGEAGVQGRRYFTLRGPQAINLHAVLHGSSHWLNNLALREYLRASSEARQRYTQAKQFAIAQGATRLMAYSDAKASIVLKLLSEAGATSLGRPEN